MGQSIASPKMFTTFKNIPHKLKQELLEEKVLTATEQELYHPAYIFSKNVLRLFPVLPETKKRKILPLFLEVCLANNWNSECKKHVKRDMIDEKLLPLYTVVCYKNDKEALESIIKESEEIKVYYYRKRAKLTAEILLLTLLKQLGDLNEKYNEYESLVVQSLEIDDYTRDIVHILNTRVHCLAHTGQMTSYEQELERIRKIAEEKEDPYLFNSYNNALGLKNIRSGNYKEAKEHFQKGLQISESVNYKLGVFSMYHNLAIVEYSLGNYKASKEALAQTLTLTDNPTYKYQIFSNLGEMCLFNGDYTESEEYFLDALKISEETGVTFNDTISLVALLYVFKKDEEKAQKYLEMSREMLQKSSMKQSSAIFHYVEGLFQQQIAEDLPAAKKSFEKCLKTAFDGNLFEYIIKSEIQLTNLALEQLSKNQEIGRYAEILYHLENLQRLSKEQDLPTIEIEVLLLLFVTHSLFNRHETALKSLKEAKRIALEENLDHYSKILEQVEDEESIIETSLARINRIKVIKQPKPVKTKIYAIILFDITTGIVHYDRMVDDEISFAIIISGLVSAINIQEKAILGGETFVDSVTIEEKKVLMEHIGQYTLAVIAENESYKLRTRLHNLANEIKEKVNLENYKEYYMKKQEMRNQLDQIVLEHFEELKEEEMF